jgi:hypothetical protein
MVVSNGSVTVSSTVVGLFHSGTLTLAGGTMSEGGPLTVGFDSFGAFWITGGELLMPNAAITNGYAGFGNIVLSNGTVVANELEEGVYSNSVGTFAVAGGSLTVYNDVTVGNCASNALGEVLLSGGTVFVTNASNTAFIDVRDGTLTVSGGTLIADELVITNACGRFIYEGGMLSITTTNLGPNLSAVGDGIPNGWKQEYGLDPFDPNLTNEDLDGTGFTVLQDYLAGVDPTNPAAAFRITSVVSTGNSLFITWKMGPGKTNALQSTSGAASGYTTNGFTDLFVVTNTVGTVTDYLDVAAATNVPARFYRVRLVP